jgi:hypothetical protein
MKTQYTIMVLGIIAAASLSIAAFGSNTTHYAVVGPQTADGLQMTGHLEMIAADANGNIKQYVQTDNAIQENGVDCIIQKLFKTSGSGSCSGSSGIYDTIVIGKGALENDLSVAVAKTGVTTAVTALEFPGENNGVADATIDTNDTVGGIGLFGANATIQSVFNADATVGVTEAILLNDTADQTTSALAYRNFTAINLEQNDSLTIAWTISVQEG